MRCIDQLEELFLQLLHLCEAESVSYLDEVANNPGSLNLAKSIALEVSLISYYMKSCAIQIHIREMIQSFFLAIHEYHECCNLLITIRQNFSQARNFFSSLGEGEIFWADMDNYATLEFHTLFGYYGIIYA